MKVFSSLIVTLVFFFSTAIAAEEVSLESADLYMSGTSCDICHKLEAIIKVENIAPIKTVKIHYQGSFFSDWKTFEASYVTQAEEGYEFWEASIPVSGSSVNFAIEYTVNGATYWDNNTGIDYSLTSPSGVLPSETTAIHFARRNFLIHQHFGDNIGLHGSVYVQNLAYDKLIKVKYTTDNWLTFNEVDASHAQSIEGNIERWGFNLALPVDASDVEFVFSYGVNGETYWDNNLGRNFSIDVSAPFSH